MPEFYVVTILDGKRRIHKLYKSMLTASKYARSYSKKHKQAVVEIDTYSVEDLPAQTRKTITSNAVIKETIPGRVDVKRIR